MTTKAAVYLVKRVRTLDAARPLAQAVAVRGGKVVAVGTRDEAVAAAGADAEVVELDGVAVPGLADAHGHLASLGRSLTVASFVGTRSLDEVLARASAAPPASRQGDWLVGRGWDQNDWPEGQRGFPDRERLDALFPDTPTFFTRIDGHAAWVNGAALKRAGVTRATRTPRAAASSGTPWANRPACSWTTPSTWSSGSCLSSPTNSWPNG